MASPQKENGYTQIANEILEHLSFAGITGSEYRIIHVVLRKTYGFHKHKDRISLSQFQLFTGMNRAHAVRTINSLVHKRILVKENGVYRFNKNWEEWVVSKRVPSTQTDTTSGTQLDTKSSTQTDTHKRKKETITKEMPQAVHKPTFNPLGEEIIKAFESVDSKNRTHYGNKTQRKACDFLLEEYGMDRVLKAIAILPQSNAEPYFPTITTPYELKERWKKLEWAFSRKKKEADALHTNKRGVIL